MKAAHLNSQSVINGRTCSAPCGSRKSMSPIPSTWSQSKESNAFRKVDGNYFAQYARKKKARAFNAVNNRVSVRFMLLVRERPACI